MKISTDELKVVLTTVKPALVSQKEIVEEQGHFLFTERSVVTYNGEISISFPLQTPFCCSVDAKDLYGLVSGITESSLEMELEEEKLKLKTENFKGELSVVKNEQYIALMKEIEKDSEEAEENKWSKINEEMLEGLKLCEGSAAREQVKGTLACIRVEGENIVAGEERKFSWYVMKEKITGVPFMFRANVLKELLKLELEYFLVTDNWVHFVTENNVRVSVRRVEGEYIKYPVAFSLPPAFVRLKLPSELSKTISSVSVLTSSFPDTNTVELIFKKGEIVCKRETTKGKAERKMAFDYEKEDLQLVIDPDLLIEILQKGVTTVQIANNKAIFRMEGFRHVVALKTKGEEENNEESSEEDIPF